MLEAERNVDGRGPTCEIIEGNKNSIRNWASGHLCYILAKNLTALCQHSQNQSETNLKRNGLVYLAEEISWQENIHAVS